MFEEDSIISDWLGEHICHLLFGLAILYLNESIWV